MIENKQIINSTDDVNIKALTEMEKVIFNIGMYIGSQDLKGLLQLFYEILSNSIDEYLAGHCSKINITLNKDGSLTVEDNGRGIPVFDKEGNVIIEKIFTIVHMGGKFDRAGYTYSGGKHGVGTTVTNYLSDYFEVEVKRNGKHYKLRFDNGIITIPTSEIGETIETGTKVTFKPSNKHFTTTEWNYEKISSIVKKQHYLTNNLEYNIVKYNENNEIENEDHFLNTEGLGGYVKTVEKDIEAKTIGGLMNYNDKIISYIHPMSKLQEQLKLSISFQYTNQSQSHFAGYTNNIYQPEGGAHIEGLKDLIYEAVSKALDSANIKIKDAIKKDYLSGIVGIVSVNLSNPTLEGQTKNKLGDTFVTKIIKDELCEELENLFLEDKKSLNDIAKHIQTNVSTRKAIENIENATLKKVKDPSADPDTKLVDAESKDRMKCELFIVEGDSAGGGLDEMRNSQFEAVYKLKGKPKNSITTGAQEILDNKELKNLIYAIGTGIGKNFDASKLRFGKIFILSDADPDGGHIQTLLLGFFKTFMPQLFVQKVIYRVIPPLYGITTNKGEKVYLKDKKALLDYQETHQEGKYIVTRFKGLGEMDPDVLYETCINSKNRIIEKIVDINIEENEDFIKNVLLEKNSDFKYDFLKNYKPVEENEKKKTSTKEISEVAQETMYDYGIYVNQERAIPNIEDGLKPVHRRTLFAMDKTLGLKSSGKTSKSANIIGAVLGGYHPHGDESVYGAAVKLTRNFYMQNPLIDKKGNFGSVFGFDDYAAYRYTEMKLSNFSEKILLKDLDLNNQIVPFSQNYDGTKLEPDVLPAILPNVLLMPTFGIGLGLSTDLPPHNISEVIDATIGCIKDGEKFNATNYIKGPDFPMPENEIISSEDQIKTIYEKGQGKIEYRVKIHYNEKEHCLEINSLPYGVEFPKIYNELKALVKGEKRKKDKKTKKEKMVSLDFDKSLKNEVKKLENHGGKGGKKNGNIVNIKIFLNKTANKDIVIAKLYKLSQLQTSVYFNPILINRHNQIKLYTLSGIIKSFVSFRKETLIKYFTLKIQNLNKQLEILNIKTIIIENAKEIANIMIDGNDEESIINDFMLKYEISKENAKYIYDVDLKQLRKLNKVSNNEKINETKNQIKDFEDLLKDENLKNYIVKELQELRKQEDKERGKIFNIKRQTEIIGPQKTEKILGGENLYEDKTVNIFISEENLIYKVSGKQIKIDNRLKEFSDSYKLKKCIIANNREKIYFVQGGKGYFFNIGDIKEENAKPISFYNDKIDNSKEIEMCFSNNINEITKDAFIILENGNISRIKIEELIKTKQGFKVSELKILNYTLSNVEINDKNEKDYCFIRLNDENLFSKHSISEIPRKQSIGGGIRLRGLTTKMLVTENNSEIEINDKLKTLKLNEIKFFTRTNKGITIENLDYLKIKQKINEDDKENDEIIFDENNEKEDE